MRLKKLQSAVVSALEDIKARDIEVIDVTKLTAMFDFVIIASADSGRQARALGQHVQDAVKQSGGKVYGIEGEQSGEWVLVDCGDTVVHIMQPTVREHYNLEELWQPKVAPKRAGRRRDEDEGAAKSSKEAVRGTRKRTDDADSGGKRKVTDKKDGDAATKKRLTTSSAGEAGERKRVRKPSTRKPAAGKPAARKPAVRKPAARKPAAPRKPRATARDE